MLLDRRLPVSYLVRKVGHEAPPVLAVAGSVALLDAIAPDVFLPLPVGIPAFLGTTISLLLSFNLSQSYDRWWEARKIWGAIVNDSRTLARQLLSFVGQDDARVRVMIRRQIAWCFVLGASLRGLDWHMGAEAHLDPAEREEVDAHHHKALALVQGQARDLAALARGGALGAFERVTIDATLTRLVDSMGAAERIRSTVFPVTYRVFLHAFVYLFLISFSVALEEVHGAWQADITIAIGIPMLVLERTARHLQDPFANRPTDTPMTTIARTIEKNLLQLLGEAAPVHEPSPSDDLFLM